MQLLSTDPDHPGIFAVGQSARGIFALGQLAVGVVAIGQLAGGVIAIGQGAGGIVAIGQGAFGVLYAGGMIAVGGRGFGICLKVLPKLVVERFERPSLPPASPFGDFLERLDRGWLLAQIDGGRLLVDGEAVPLELTEEAQRQLREALQAGHSHACVSVAVEERVADGEAGYREAVERARVPVGLRLKSWLEAPPAVRLEGPMTSVPGLLLRAVGMALLLAGWWAIPGRLLADIFGQ